MIQAKGCRIMISVVSMEGAEQTRGPAYLEPAAFQAEGLRFRTFTYSLAPDFRFGTAFCRLYPAQSFDRVPPALEKELSQVPA